MNRVTYNECPCTILLMSDKKTLHCHFCKKHGGPEKNYFTKNDSFKHFRQGLTTTEEPDDLSCSCKERIFARESKTEIQKMISQDFKPLTEAGLRVVKQFIRMYPGTEVAWKLHKKEWPIEIEAPTSLDFPYEKLVTENGLEKLEIEYAKKIVFHDWQHLLYHIKHGLRPYKTTWDSKKAKFVPSEPLTLRNEDVL